MKTKLLVLGWLLICPAIILAFCILSIKGVSTISASSRLFLIYCAALVLWSSLSLIIDSIVRLKKVPGYFSKRTVFNIVLIISLILTIFQPVIGLTLGLEGRLPNYEKRFLAGKPVLNNETLTSLPHDVEAYINDNFGFRKMLMNWNSVARVTYFKTSSVSDVVLGKDNWLFSEPNVRDSHGFSQPFTELDLLTIRNNIEERRDWLAKRGIAYMIVIAPDKETIYPEYLPNTVSTVSRQTRLDQLLDYLKSNSDAQVLDLRPALLEAKAMHIVYYKTDTHWNHYGAFVGYCEIMKQLSAHFPVLSVPSLSEYQLVEKKVGSPGNLAEMLSMPDTPISTDVVLDENALSNQTKLKSAVVFGDSFRLGLAPYLLRNFKSVDFQPGENPVYFDSNMIKVERPDVVIEIWSQLGVPRLQHVEDQQHLWTSSPLQGMSLPEGSHDITLNINPSKRVTQDGSEIIEISGWGFINGQSSENSKIYVVLQSDSNTYVFNTLPQYKPYLTTYYHTLGVNLDEAAFLARIPKDDIGNATYRIGVYVEKDGIEALGWSHQSLEK